MSRSPLFSAFISEWHKLQKRPANLAMALITISSVILFAYILPYVQFHNPRFAYSAMPALQASYFHPAAFLHAAISFAPILSALALVIGALAAGGEYSYGTLRVVFTQGPSRQAAFFGGFAAQAFFLLILTLATYLVAALSSVFFALIDNQGLGQWPTFATILAALAATWLIFMVFAAFGVFLSHVFRQPASAISLGLAYLIIVEGLLVHYLLGLNSQLDSLLKLLPTVNSQSLVASFSPTPFSSQALVNIVSVPQALAMLLVYLALFLLLSGSLLCRRDVL